MSLGSSIGQAAHDLTGLKPAQPELLREVLFGQSVQESAWPGPGQITQPGLAWPATEPGPRPSLVEPPESLPTPSWCLLGPPEASLGLLGPPGASCGLLKHAGKKSGASWGLLWPLEAPGASWASWGLLGPPGAS